MGTQGGPPLNTSMMRPESGLDFILPLIAMLTKVPEMLQTMRFASMQQNATAAVALCSEPRWSSGLYSASPDPLAGFKGVASWR